MSLQEEGVVWILLARDFSTIKPLYQRLIKLQKLRKAAKTHTRHPSKSRPRNPNPPLKKDGIMPQNPRTPDTSRNGFIPDMLRPSLFFSAYSLISMIALHAPKDPRKSPLCYRLVICWWLFPSVALIRLFFPNSPTSSELPAVRRCQLGRVGTRN